MFTGGAQEAPATSSASVSPSKITNHYKGWGGSCSPLTSSSTEPSWRDHIRKKGEQAAQAATDVEGTGWDQTTLTGDGLPLSVLKNCYCGSEL